MKDTSSDVFADFTLSRIPLSVRRTLSDEQYAAIRAALVASKVSQKHQFDFRVRLPLFFRAYYFVLFAGRDRRSKTLDLELIRIRRIPLRIRRMFYFLATTAVIGGVVSILFLAVYLAKSFAGIDLFSQTHLSDLIGVDFYGSLAEVFGSEDKK